MSGAVEEREPCQVGDGSSGPLVAMIGREPEHACSAVERWKAEGVTADCADNDETSLAVLAGMRLLDLIAPSNMAGIGVDDIPPARLAAPPLSTVPELRRGRAGHRFPGRAGGGRG